MSEYTNYFFAKLNDLDKAVVLLEDKQLNVEIINVNTEDAWYILLAHTDILKEIATVLPLCGHVFVDKSDCYWYLSFSLFGKIIRVVHLQDEQKSLSNEECHLLANSLKFDLSTVEKAMNQDIWSLLTTLGLPAEGILDQDIEQIRLGVTRPDCSQADAKIFTVLDKQATNDEIAPTLQNKPKKLKRVAGENHGSYFTDGKLVYFSWSDTLGPFSEILNADCQSFTYLGGYWAKDDNFVYWQGEPISDIDVSSYTTDGFWAKDKNQVYYCGEIIVEADANTFDWSIGDSYAKDKYHVFYQGKMVSEADMVTFEALGGSYSRDKFVVFFQGRLVSGADPDSFISIAFAQGKDKLYTYYHDKRDNE